MAVPELPQKQDTAGPATGEVPGGVFSGLAFGTTTTQAEQPVDTVVSAATQPGEFSSADKRELMVACRHEIPDSSGRHCGHCGKCLHRDIIIEGGNARHLPMTAIGRSSAGECPLKLHASNCHRSVGLRGSAAKSPFSG